MNSNPHAPVADPASATVAATVPDPPSAPVTEPGVRAAARELGGREGLEPTRYGDWELRGRCIDF